MNWLAHLVLAGDSTFSRLGQLAGDFVRGDEIEALRPELAAAVRDHRALDARVDAHPAMRRSRHRIVGPLSRWAPVLCDVFYDHLLAAGFRTLVPGSDLDRFVDGVHAELVTHLPLLPPRLQAVVPRLIRERWLASYVDLDGVRLTLTRMQARVRRPVALAEGVAQLASERDGFRADFEELWSGLRGEGGPPT